MSTLSTQAESAAKTLLRADKNQLYEQLGMRVKAIKQDPSTAGSFDPRVVYDQAEMGAKEEIFELGQRFFRRWNKEAYQLACGSEAKDTADRKDLMASLGVSDIAVAAVFSGILVTTVGLAPAIAAVIAALIVKRFFRPTYEEFCQEWKKHVTD